MLFFPSVVLSATTGLSQSKFEINGAPGDVVTKEIWVTNTDVIEQKYEFKIDDSSFLHNINIVPQNFFLNPEEFKKVIIRFRVPLETQKIYLSLLTIDSNQSNQLKVRNGIKIPVQFNVQKVAGASVVNQNIHNISFNFFSIIVWTLNIVLIGFVIWHQKKRKIIL